LDGLPESAFEPLAAVKRGGWQFRYVPQKIANFIEKVSRLYEQERTAASSASLLEM
jgi:hypothetical protein